MIRVGRCIYDKRGKRNDPSFPGFTPIIVLMSSHSEWGVLGPYNLKNEEGQIFENKWQFSRCFEKVPKTTQYYSRWSNVITWDHPEEIHIENDKTNDKYWKWREKGMNNKYYIRYPVGFNYRHNVKYALHKNCSGVYEKLDYIESRKKIYVKEYGRLVKKEPKFIELQERLKKGENLLIIEVDACHEDSIPYYKEKYGVSDNFIINNTMLVTDDNIKIMLNDPKHPFGHGYCLSMALLNKEDEWNTDYIKKENFLTNNQTNEEKKNIGLEKSDEVKKQLKKNIEIAKSNKKNNAKIVVKAKKIIDLKSI